MNYSKMTDDELRTAMDAGRLANDELGRRQKAKYEKTLRSYVGKYFSYYGIGHSRYRRYDSVATLDRDFCAIGVEVMLDDDDGPIHIDTIIHDEPTRSSRWIEISTEEGTVIFKDIAGKANRILNGVGV